MIRLSSLFAAKISPGQIGLDNPVTDPGAAIGGLLSMVYMWAGIVAVIVIIIAGYLFITARGDPGQVKRAKDAIRGAIIGLVVVIMAFAITQFVIGRF